MLTSFALLLTVVVAGVFLPAQTCSCVVVALVWWLAFGLHWGLCFRRRLDVLAFCRCRCAGFGWLRVMIDGHMLHLPRPRLCHL